MSITETDYLDQTKTNLTTPTPDYDMGLRDQVKKHLPAYQLVMQDPTRDGGLYWNTETKRFVRLDRTPAPKSNNQNNQNDD